MRVLTLIMVLPVLVLAQSPDQTLEPWGSNHHPTDAPQHHVEQIADGRHVYTVRQGGTMDGTNCRSPVGVGMSDGPAIQQTWESNRFAARTSSWAVGSRWKAAGQSSRFPGTGSPGWKPGRS